MVRTAAHQKFLRFKRRVTGFPRHETVTPPGPKGDIALLRRNACLPSRLSGRWFPCQQEREGGLLPLTAIELTSGSVAIITWIHLLMRRVGYYVVGPTSGAQQSASVMTTSTATRGLVLVTGGSGEIAGYCIAQLLSEGWRVRTTVRTLRGPKTRERPSARSPRRRQQSNSWRPISIQTQAGPTLLSALTMFSTSPLRSRRQSEERR